MEKAGGDKRKGKEGVFLHQRGRTISVIFGGGKLLRNSEKGRIK